MSAEQTVSADLTDEVLVVVSGMINVLLGDYGLEADEQITLSTTFHDDLELESVDLVTLADLLAQRYGPQANLAEFFAEKDMDEVIAMTVGDVVGYVVRVVQVGGQVGQAPAVQTAVGTEA